MRAYHLDLRQRVVAAVEDGTPITTVATQFRLHRSTIYRYLAQRQERGTLVPRTSPGRVRTITAAAEVQLVAQLQQHPTATLAEHCAVWAQTNGVRLSPATLSRAIRRVGWTRKKGQWQPASVTLSSELPGGTRH
jgi:transposase